MRIDLSITCILENVIYLVPEICDAIEFDVMTILVRNVNLMKRIKGKEIQRIIKGSEEGSKTRNDNQQYYNKFFHYKNMPPSLKLKEGRKPLVFILFYQSNCRIRIVLESYLQPLGVIVQEVEHVDR